MITQIARISGVAAAFTMTATAGASVFTDRGDFESAASTAGVPLDGFESFEDFPAEPTNFMDVVDANGFEVTGFDTLDGFESIFTVENNAQSGLVPTDGDQVLRVSTFDGSVVTLNFDNPVNAVGLDLIGTANFGDPAEAALTVETSADESLTLIEGEPNSANDTFFAGFVSNTPFDSITITNSYDGDSYGIDSVSYGVPAPGSAALLGLAGLAATRRRR